MNKELIQSIEEGKKIYLDGIWYRKTNGTFIEEKSILQNFTEIVKCPLCGEDILTEQDRKSLIVWGKCLGCYYHNK